MSMDERYFNKNIEPLEGIETDEFMSLVRPKIEQAISLRGLETRIREGRPLNIKFGTDPTGPELHLGHAVPVRLLDLFRRAGHKIDIIFGDFTAKIGDPSGRTEGRQELTDEQIRNNMSTYTEQAGRYFGIEHDNVRTRKNSEWLAKLSLAETFGYLQMISLSEATQRNDFRNRMARGQKVSYAEGAYGALTGIDSVELRTDVEIGGVDQLLNFQQARSIQSASGQPPEEILMTPILEGVGGDGRKMSKSFDNYIPVDAKPEEMFGKIMSMPDHLIASYWQAFAPINEADIQKLKETISKDPLELKKQLATYLVALAANDMKIGQDSRESFEIKFSRKDYMAIEHVPLIVLGDSESVIPTIANIRGESNSQIMRLFKQGAVRVITNESSTITVYSPEELLKNIVDGQLLKVGKTLVRFTNTGPGV